MGQLHNSLHQATVYLLKLPWTAQRVHLGSRPEWLSDCEWTAGLGCALVHTTVTAPRPTQMHCVLLYTAISKALKVLSEKNLWIYTAFTAVVISYIAQQFFAVYISEHLHCDRELRCSAFWRLWSVWLWMVSGRITSLAASGSFVTPPPPPRHQVTRQLF